MLSLLGVLLYLNYGLDAWLLVVAIGAVALARVLWVERAQTRVRAVLQPDGDWRWHERGVDVCAALVDYADLGAWIGLTYRLSTGRTRHLALWADSVDAGARHALTVWLGARRDPNATRQTVTGQPYN